MESNEPAASIKSDTNSEENILNFNLQFNEHNFNFSLYELEKKKLKLIAEEAETNNLENEYYKYEKILELSTLKSSHKYFKMFDDYSEFKDNFIALCNSKKVGITSFEKDTINLKIDLALVENNIFNIELKKVEIKGKEKEMNNIKIIQNLNLRIEELEKNSKLKDDKILSLEKEMEKISKKNLSLEKELNELKISKEKEIKDIKDEILQLKNNFSLNKKESLKDFKNFDLEKKVFQSEKYDGNDIEIVFSDKSGVGKSTQIKKEIENNKKKWIYFPLGGVFNEEDIINRLKELKIENNSVLHLDLYENDQLSLINNFLFSILINKTYYYKEDIFYLPKDIEFKIELQNCFKNLFIEYPILNKFPKKELKISNLAPLIVPKELNSDIQIVANYLKTLKEDKINNYDLFFPAITPSDFENRFYYIKKKKFSTTLKATLLSDAECQKLIFDEIKLYFKEPNYYIISAFIKVLSTQLKKLNQNFFLNAHQLLTCIGESECPKRTIIIKSIMKLAVYLSKRAFTNFLENEKNINVPILGNIDEIKHIDKNNNHLSKDIHQIASFNKNDLSLFFFHVGEGQLFSIITNKSPEDKEYFDLLALKNIMAFSEKDYIRKLPNYIKYSQVEFLEELKEIFDVKNPVYKKENSYKSLEEIFHNYIITPENFFKMILLLLHISSNIPIIIMGEEGMGISSMIKKVFELINNGNSFLKTFNVKPETTNNDIINFVKHDVIPEAECINKTEKVQREEYKKMNLYFHEKKLGILFDEINLCKSMEIISELVIKNSLQGQNLPSNIVFMATCYPYIKGDQKVILDENKKALLNSLSEERKEVINRIIEGNSDRVYPLPHSLLNFVIDFGTLTSREKEYYIDYLLKSMKK